MDYSLIRGFNVHGDWGRNGVTEWLNFDAARYEYMIAIGKERFPTMNTVRIWLSFDAYMADKPKYLTAIKRATDILTKAGLAIMPVYYNGWFGVPSFGAIIGECVQAHHYPYYERCIQDSICAIKDANILMHDICNEPFNNSWSNTKTMLDFLTHMAKVVRETDDRPITGGSLGYPHLGDIDQLAPIVDVFSLHPYNIERLSAKDFEARFRGILDYIKPFGKPYIISECIWGTATADERRHYLESELSTYSKHGVGFLCHSLFTCPVADLYPWEDGTPPKNFLYMAFLDKDFNVRPHHDMFSRY